MGHIHVTVVPRASCPGRHRHASLLRARDACATVGSCSGPAAGHAVTPQGCADPGVGAITKLPATWAPSKVGETLPVSRLVGKQEEVGVAEPRPGPARPGWRFWRGAEQLLQSPLLQDSVGPGARRPRAARRKGRAQSPSAETGGDVSLPEAEARRLVRGSAVGPTEARQRKPPRDG